MQYVRSSTTRAKKFKECVDEERIESEALLALDVCTRWNSTYLMLDTALKFRKAFDRMIGDGNYDIYFQETEQGKVRDGPPTDFDWENAKVYANSKNRPMCTLASYVLVITPDTCRIEYSKIHPAMRHHRSTG